MTQPPPTRQRQTADRLIQAFNTQDTTTIISLRSPTCTRVFHPLSLHFTPQSNDLYLANLNSMNSIFTSFQLTVDDVVEDVAGRKICMWVTALGQTAVGEYNNEYVWKMGFDESGEVIVSWDEFVDVGMVRDFFPKLKAELVRKREELGREGEGGKD